MTIEATRKVRSDAITDAERPWVDVVATIGVLGTVEELVARDISQPKAAAIAVWLEQKRLGRRPATSTESAALYRRTLAALKPPIMFASVIWDAADAA